MKISITPATFIMFVCMIATMPMRQLSACLLASILHECGHVLAAKYLQINLSQMKLDILGARLVTTGKLCSYPAMVVLCLSGPIVNLCCFALTLPLMDKYVWFREFCVSSLSLGFVNLIPIEGFDGGRILQGILSAVFPLPTVERTCSILSFICLLVMWLLSVWLLLCTGSSLTLFVFSCCLFAMLFV